MPRFELPQVVPIRQRFLLRIVLWVYTRARIHLIDRLVNVQPDSLLTHLARAGRHAACNFVWEHPDYTSFPESTRRLIRHAEVFSAVMHGAALLYNLMLAERRENEEWIERYRDELSEWREMELDRTAVSLWSLDDFWRCIEHEGHRIRDRARRFVHRWCELADEHGGDIAELPAARDLVQEREKTLKRSQSRFVNRTVIDKWGGGTARSAMAPATISRPFSTSTFTVSSSPRG